MQITRIKVSNLYGLHHYDILFSNETCLKIIHAPNGYGKTTILRLIKDILEGDYHAIYSVPFDSFIMIFDSKEELEVVKNDQLIYRFKSLNANEDYQVSRDLTSNKFISSNKLIHLEERLQDIRSKMPIYFINASRLWIESKNDKDETKSLLPTVLEYAKELTEWMRQALAQANYSGQALDASFPVRLMQSIENEKESGLTHEEIEEGLKQLEATRIILQKVGLFSKSMAQRDYAIESVNEVSDSLRKVLTLYLSDSKEKLKPFEKLATKIHLLCELINKRFSYKVMEVNMEDGFIFKVPTHETLKADKLSSGEQNELILMFQLLFKSPNNAMILLDEPEISLHIAWQQSFLEDMEAIARVSNIRMMIATHSPDIINGRWDLTSGLEEVVCRPI